ncbi:hybrid sensor histidine kinase/response regulator [Oceanisphaera pacifica]|uniref:histidine kinase n=1 Tax=Oceanisphaera pacifica TaxID=2818389 RepID=A0ABS3NHQ9_9GAMM|nr:GAF domain-containing protein [Oceanisphaera pacifica]MBO1519825.1 PAS domain S-box protein [Oceanisphaera pacifica]
MISPLLPANEAERLALLHELKILDTPAEPAFDQLMELTAQVLQVPIALVSLIDTNRQWFKAKVGLDACETGRDISFCGHVVADNKPLIVEDARKDARFADNPLVTGEASIRFYAGIPLHVYDEKGAQACLGTLCIIDTQPRQLSEQQLSQLTMFAKQAEQLLLLHQQRLLLEHQGMLSDYRLAQYEAITTGAAAGIIRINGQGLIQEINNFALTLLGYKRGEVINRNVKVLMPSQWADHHDGYIDNYIHTGTKKIIGQGRRVCAQHKDGRHIPIHLAVEQIRDPHHTDNIEFIGILTDLTDEFEAEQRERDEHALLRSIIDASRDPIFAVNGQGEYLIANQAFIDLFPESITDVTGLTPAGFFTPTLLQAALESDSRVFETGRTESVRIELDADTRFDVTKSPLLNAAGEIYGVVSVAHNINDIWHTQRKLEKQQQLLSVLHRGLTDYHALMSGNQLWAFLKAALRELTNSQYLFIGEVLTENELPVLKMHAITEPEPDWNEDFKSIIYQLRSGEIKIRNTNNIIGQVFDQGRVIINNDLSGQQIEGFPEGHPPFHNYLGVPIISDGEVIGMYAMTNCEEDYTQDLVTWLEPFNSTCALLIKLYRQLNEQEEFTAQLREARDAAEQASRAKTDFLSSMSHELRTPLNAIMGFAQLLESNKRTPLNDRQYRQVEQIYKSGGHLLNLINEVLDLAKIEVGHINMSLEPITLYEVVSEACDGLMPIAKKYHIQLEVDNSLQQAPLITADYTRLKQVIINLVSNAIKYNQAHGRVDVFCQAQQDMLVISIKDTGKGVDPKDMDQLFKPFNRLGAENSAIEGTGVGLALTKNIIEKMGGYIGVKSELEQGSEFWFKLPLVESAKNHIELDITAQPATLTTQLSPAISQAKLNTILYVEDNPANQRLMKDVVAEQDDMQLICAHSAELAFEIACSDPPDLILMDINLPGMSGIDAASLLGRNPLTANIPMVALSANAMSSDVKKASQAGFKEYLTKPINVQQLLVVLNTLLEPTR